MKFSASAAVLFGLIGFSMVAAGQTPASSSSSSSGYAKCSGYFALCTLAKCGPPPSKGATFLPTTYTCSGCYVLNGYSVASTPPACPAPITTKPSAGAQIQSRFALMQTVNIVTCNNSVIWANCLDAKCTVDSNTNYATCTCSSQTATPYVAGIVTGLSGAISGPQACSGNPVISSESALDSGPILNFWNGLNVKSYPPPPPPPAAPTKK